MKVATKQKTYFFTQRHKVFSLEIVSIVLIIAVEEDKVLLLINRIHFDHTTDLQLNIIYKLFSLTKGTISSRLVTAGNDSLYWNLSVYSPHRSKDNIFIHFIYVYLKI